MSFWDTIIETNTFNFVILIIIFAVIFKKLNISEIVSKIKGDIISSIENAISEKENSINKLNDAQGQYDSLDTELKNRKLEAMQKSDAIVSQILSNANDRIKSIESNAKTSILAEEKTINAKAIDKTLKNSTILAEKLIIQKLKEKPELHKKFIQESIGEL